LTSVQNRAVGRPLELLQVVQADVLKQRVAQVQLGQLAAIVQLVLVQVERPAQSKDVMQMYSSSCSCD
jgi:hypothetical protein